MSPNPYHHPGGGMYSGSAGADENFRGLSAYPTGAELMEPINLNALSPILLKGPYRDVEHYLALNSRLFRADFVRTLGKGIRKYRQSLPAIVADGIVLYPGTTFKGIRITKSRKLGILINFQHKKKWSSKDDWRASRQLMQGNLLIFTSDNFRSYFYGTVLERDMDQDEIGQILIETFDGQLPNYSRILRTKYLMVEPETAFFEPYYCVLEKLKTLNNENFPLKDYIVYSGHITGPRMPTYLTRVTKYWNIMGKAVYVRQNAQWPPASHLQMNDSQYEAFKAALTSALCVIQGPPGTGKTFVGLKIVEALLKNISEEEKPILIVCQTNHALDQFLKGVLKFTDRIVRTGGGSTIKDLLKYDLRGGKVNMPHGRLRNARRTALLNDVRVAEERVQNMTSEYLSYESVAPDVVQTVNHYRSKSNVLKKFNQEMDAQILASMDVIGMTTTGAAKMREVLQAVKPVITIVEEAAEVLEVHTVASLTAYCQQLILIGDHKQLRPILCDNDLSRIHHLDMSLFERLINNGIHYTTLRTQHRMRPEISKLIRLIYSNLEDAPVVQKYKPVRGMSENIFFMDHKNYEETVAGSTSKRNPFEVSFLLSLCRHLLNQGYHPSRITILTPYASQAKLFLKSQKTMVNQGDAINDVECITIDKYQGEENDIILLSLVRSQRNEKASIGFLGVENRVNVALSRAKLGLYIVGNMSHLSGKSSLWQKIKETLKKQGEIGTGMKITCYRHKLLDALVSEGRDIDEFEKHKCGKLLECKHKCQLPCHGHSTNCSCGHRHYQSLEREKLRQTHTGSRSAPPEPEKELLPDYRPYYTTPYYYTPYVRNFELPKKPNLFLRIIRYFSRKISNFFW